MKAIILAAGLGKRLGKITKEIPKPLLPIKGIPIIGLIIKKIKNAGIKNIGINTFYKADMVEEYLKKFKDLKIVREEYLSGTGGALLNFRNFVSEDFLIHNCDILSNIDLKRVISMHKRIKPLATIVLVDNYKTNRVRISKNYAVKFYKKRTEGCYTYTGIAVLSKRIFKYFPENKKVFSLTEVYNMAIKKGELIHCLLVRNIWYDIGTYKVYNLLQHNSLETLLTEFIF